MSHIIRAKSVKIQWNTKKLEWMIIITGASDYVIVSTLPAATDTASEELLLRLAARVLKLDDLTMPDRGKIEIIR